MSTGTTYVRHKPFDSCGECRRHGRSTLLFQLISPAAIKRYTITSRFWPMRYALSTACMSSAGFQLGSNRITLSAPVRVMPVPPAAVLGSPQQRRTRGGGGETTGKATQRLAKGQKKDVYRYTTVTGIYMRTATQPAHS